MRCCNCWVSSLTGFHWNHSNNPNRFHRFRLSAYPSPHLHQIITKTEQPRITKITNHKTKQRAEQNLALANEIRENFLASDLLYTSTKLTIQNLGLSPLDQNATPK